MSLRPRAFAERLVALLPQLMREISRSENNYVSRGKITCQQFLVLERVAQKERWKMNDLVASLETSFSTATGMIDRLVSHQLVRRDRGREDRRTVWVSVTVKGDNVLSEVTRQKREGIQNVFKRLSGEERRQYLHIIEKLVKDLSAAEGNSA